MYVYMSAGLWSECRHCGGQEHTASLMLELQVVFSNLTWMMLETEPRSSAKAVYTLNH